MEEKGKLQSAEEMVNESASEKVALPVIDTSNLGMEQIVEKAKELTENYETLEISKLMSELKKNLDKKVEIEVNQVKTQFLENGGNTMDFVYDNPSKKAFDSIYYNFKNKRDKLYDDRKKQQVKNLTIRENLIEELKNLYEKQVLNGETFATFKSIQERWKQVGNVPREKADFIYKTYFYNLNKFYEYIDLSKNFKNVEFKKNLEKRLHIIERAEVLAKEPNVQKAFNELQYLHKVWKEVGAVERAHSEETWNAFKKATKAVHERRDELNEHFKTEYTQGLKVKSEALQKIKTITQEVASEKLSHKAWQKRINSLESLREDFIKSGNVSKEDNTIWDEFKEAVRSFNREKNKYYKTLKREQSDNLNKKQELVKLANALKDSTDWKSTANVLKKIQKDWREIGHVPRKYSDKLWKEFRESTNYFFDRFHSNLNKKDQVFYDNFDAKKALLEEFKKIEINTNVNEAIEQATSFSQKWSSLGKVPNSKLFIEKDFDKFIDKLFKNLNVSESELAQIKFDSKMDSIVASKNEDNLYQYIHDLKQLYQDKEQEKLQLENNLSFFSNAEESNPLVKDVIDRINEQKTLLAVYKLQIKQLRLVDFQAMDSEE